MLHELAKDNEVEVIKAVATNPSIPIEISKELSKDEEIEIRKIVAANPSTPIKILEELSEEEDLKIYVAKNAALCIEEPLVEIIDHQNIELDSLSLEELENKRNSLQEENKQKEAELQELSKKQKMIEEIKALIERKNQLDREIAQLRQAQKDETSR